MKDVGGDGRRSFQGHVTGFLRRWFIQIASSDKVVYLEFSGILYRAHFDTRIIVSSKMLQK